MAVFNHFLVKSVKAVLSMIPNEDMELSYGGAKDMLLVDDVENKSSLRGLFDSMYGNFQLQRKEKK